MTSIQPLPGPFGMEIHGIDISHGVTDDTMRLLTRALYEHKVIVLRDQRLDQEQYLRFGRRWGTPIAHVLDHMRMPDFPELMTVGNTEERDKENLIRNGAALWHTDQSYEQIPASATMLYSIKVPHTGGETRFCNMAAAYDDLDDTLKARLDKLEVAHKYGKGRRRAGELAVNPLLNEEQDKQVPVVYHPLVLPHPITRHKALYALGHGAHGIKAMPDDAADALLESLKEHVLQEKYVYRHRYATGDVAIWDTLQTMHCATPIEIPTNAAEERLLWRISVRGKPMIYRQATVAAQLSEE